MLNFVKCFFCIYWDDHAVSVFLFANVVYHDDSSAYVEQFLQPWNHYNLIMVYEPTLYCCIQLANVLLKIFLHQIHQRWMACVCVLSPFSCVWLCVTLWTVAHQAPWFMGFSRQESWCGLPCPPPGDLPDPGIEPASPTAPALQADSLPLSHQGSSITMIRTIILICFQAECL